MASRFYGRDSRPHRGNDPRGLSSFEQGTGAITIVALATLAVVALGESRTPGVEPPTLAPSLELLAVVAPAERALSDVEGSFSTLCGEPALIAVDLVPDCETGALILTDEHFGGFGRTDLLPEARDDLIRAMKIYLSRLRETPALWASLEALEIRGHSDPRAVRNPYVTNMVGSQQRPLGVLISLVGPQGLSERDRIDLERLAVVSGASFSRPPATCPDERRECYSAWRRVEIRPILSESLRRGDWSRTLQDVRVTAERLRAASQETRRR